MMTETNTTVVYLAGFLSGRGGFGTTDGYPWIYFITLDREVADEAVYLWGGHATPRDYKTRAGELETQWKWQAKGGAALEALAELAPHLRGYKREKAEAMLKQYEAA